MRAAAWRRAPTPGSKGPPYCHTVYYLDTATGVLGGFWTISTRYATSRGTRVGTAEHSAASRERRRRDPVGVLFC